MLKDLEGARRSVGVMDVGCLMQVAGRVNCRLIKRLTRLFWPPLMPFIWSVSSPMSVCWHSTRSCIVRESGHPLSGVGGVGGWGGMG